MDDMTYFKENQKSPKLLTETAKNEMEETQSTLSKEDTTNQSQNVGGTQSKVPENIGEIQTE